MGQNHTEYGEAPMTRGGTVQGPSRRYRRLRHPTFPAAEWTAKNPLLQRGEFGVESDTHRIKAGDGYTLWNDLPYVEGDPTNWGEIGGDIADQTDLKDVLDTINGNITALDTAVAGKVSKSGDTMTGALRFNLSGTNEHGAIGAYANGIALYAIGNNDSFDPVVIADKSGSTRVVRAAQSNSELGSSVIPWKNLFVQTINNGSNLAVPNPGQADTLGLKSEIDLAANSGSQLTNKGVWFAKMYAATTVPTGAEYDGKNYADFSQVDGNGDPIIVLYEGQSGAWVQTQTITPPASYNGYVTVTSKIWDISEQTGQQGGLVLWAYNTKTFTPYPRIVGTDGLSITNSSFSGGTITSSTFAGDATLDDGSTMTMPAVPTNDSVTNKGYVDSAISTAVASVWDLFDWKWRDATTSKTGWKLSDGNWVNKADDAETAYNHLVADIDGKTLQTETVAGITISFYLADDGHKIILPDQETNANTIYTATGTAWYYILDEANQRFKLPRAKPLNGAIVGNGQGLGLTADNTTIRYPVNFAANNDDGSFSSTTGSTAIGSLIAGQNTGDTNQILGITTNPTKSGVIAERGATDQYKYLYFYIGQ